MRIKTSITLLAAHCLIGTASATLIFTGSYSQNFSSLQNTPNVDSNAATAPAWTNDSTLDGWYGGGNATLAAGYGVGNGSDNTMLSSGTTAVGSFGSTGDSDRALAPLKRNNSAFIALALLNDTGSALTDLSIQYTAERWRDNAANVAGAVGLDFSYQANASGIFTGTWTAVPSLSHSAPEMTGAGTLDGNLAANRETLTFTVTGLNIPDGETVWLRWGQRGTGNNGSYVAVDDFSVSAIPEPGTLTMLGVAFAALLLFRRKRG